MLFYQLCFSYDIVEQHTHLILASYEEEEKNDKSIEDG
jgi:hypothetical protein